MDVEHQYYTNTSGSCSIEQAVAKLLGWSKGPLFRKTVRVTEAGVVDDDLALVEVFEGGIDAQLESMLIDAQNQAIVALDEGATHDELSRLDKRIEQVMELVARVHDFRIRIDDELAKGQGSRLRIDPRRSDESGNVYLTLMSLDEWAFEVYGCRVIARGDVAERVSQQTDHQLAAEQVNEAAGTDSKNALIVVSLLQDLLMEVSATKYKHGGKPNKSTIAQRLSEVAISAGIDKFGDQKLRKVLADADKVRWRESGVKARRP
jgi:hypothetical protein